MLFSAVSSRCFSNSSRCCASRFCRVICRMITNRMKAITSADRAAATTMNLVCARQSASAAETVMVATTTIGKWLSGAAEPSRS